jgi:hypothetical protein
MILQTQSDPSSPSFGNQKNINTQISSKLGLNETASFENEKPEIN